jgi:hypothetical protein
MSLSAMTAAALDPRAERRRKRSRRRPNRDTVARAFEFEGQTVDVEKTATGWRVRCGEGECAMPCLDQALAGALWLPPILALPLAPDVLTRADERSLLRI